MGLSNYCKQLFLYSCFIGLGCAVSKADNFGGMKEWSTHFSYANFTDIIASQTDVFALANGSLCVFNKDDEEITNLDKLTGLHGSNIVKIAFNPTVSALLITYTDGGIDILSKDEIIYISDLASNPMRQSKEVNSIFIYGEDAYLAMPFGIMKINMAKKEISDTYFIGWNSTDANIKQVVILQDSIFAISQDSLYTAHLKTNLLDFSVWHRTKIEGIKVLQNIVSWGDSLVLLADNHLFLRDRTTSWKSSADTNAYDKIKVSHNHLYTIRKDGMILKDLSKESLFTIPAIVDISYDGDSYWVVKSDDGSIYKYRKSGEHVSYFAGGPAINTAYRMYVFNDKLYVVPGGRWFAQYFTEPYVMIFDGISWTNIYPYGIRSKTGKAAYDFMNVAVDPLNPDHFFVTSYGTGLYEFYGYSLFRRYGVENSPLISAANETDLYTRTDGAFFDTEGNLWFLNIESEQYKNIHIIRPGDISEDKPFYNWNTLPLTTGNSTGSPVFVGTPQEVIVDRNNTAVKWIPQARPGGLFLFYDAGTPFDTSDDMTVYRNTFADQDNNIVNVGGVYSATQDKNGVIWLGLDNGIITIPSLDDFVASNSCNKIKIPRNDGTDFADYLLDGIQISAIAVDGGNRKWIGTSNSGVYLMSEDGIETIEHFTTENSPLPTNEILSIAINPKTGRVFIGTPQGIVSYQSDAAEGEINLKNSNIYAYPNPVRPDYDGYITIMGLVENTTVYITDSYGNLICKTYSNGGLAIWDGRDGRGKKVASGVYTVLCNTNNGTQHGTCKVLIIK